MAINLPANALEVFIKRYSLRDENGKPVESVEDIFSRVARVVAESENQYRDGIDPKIIYQKFREYLYALRFMPNGRTIANAGTGSGQLANCFVLPIEDDLGKMENSIFSTLRNAVLILQSGGGVGFSFGRLRHKGAFISTSKGKATGAVSFLKIYDTAFWVIGQGGGRRSACMAVLPVHHPDIEDFITCKENEGEIEHFNISVGITDKFMEAVEKKAKFPLIDPHTHEVVRYVKADQLFEKIATNAYKNGEPGVLFLDTANSDNPVADQYDLEATNPCGEQWLGPGENCCMASVNLRLHVKAKTNKKKTTYDQVFDQEIDWRALQETVEVATRFLDDVIDANKYVPAVPLLQEAAFKNRRIGLSIMGLADLLYQIGIPYGSQEAEDLAGQIMEFIKFHTMKTSVQLARERGVFPGINQSIYNKRNFRFKLNKPLITGTSNFKRPLLDWKKLIKDIKQYGIRNAAQNTIAPTGAIATVTGLEGYGCEPVFSLSYIMKTHEGADFEGGEDFKKLYYESELFAQALRKAGISKSKREIIFNKVRKTGTCQGIAEVPEYIRKVFVVSSDLTATQHVRMQAALQRFVDNSISKTINFPNSATIEDVEKSYLQAWKLKCKGITVYVTGSRTEVVLEAGKKEEKTTPNYSINETTDFRGKPLVKQRPAFVSIDNETSAGRPGEHSRETRYYMRPKVCPECGVLLTKGEGCVTCPECGWSKCDV